MAGHYRCGRDGNNLSVYGTSYEPTETPEQKPQEPPTFSITDLPEYRATTIQSPIVDDTFDGEKYYGGYGNTNVLDIDYWTLRTRSAELFTRNIFARGVIRRIITNWITTGLCVEAMPQPDVLGIDESTLSEWSETVENRFALWSKTPALCDYQARRTFGDLQRECLREALISGDCLVVLHQSKRTKLPLIQLISGADIVSPTEETLRSGHTVEHGVEMDSRGRQVAYWVSQDDDTVKRVPAFGARTGRRVSWLVYGSDNRLDDVRGQPLLSLMLQSLKELDRYRDATLRKATLNAILAMFVEKTEERMSSLPLTGGAIRKANAAVTDSTGRTRQFGIADQIPGLVIEELQVGEKIVPHSTQGTDVEYGKFEAAVIQAIAWAHEIPPEILTLSFQNNYSASQAATNEFKMTLETWRTKFGSEMPQLVYVEWLLSETLLQKINTPGLLDARRDPMKYDVYAAWLNTDWSGAIKPSVDIVKQGKGYQILVQEGWITNARSARELTGTKWSHNIKQIARENELKAAAMRPLLELQAEFGPSETDAAEALLEDGIQSILEDGIQSILEAVEEK